MRKSLLNNFQPVGSEAIGLFSLFPFHLRKWVPSCIVEFSTKFYLVLALIVATTEFKDKTPPAVFLLLQIFVIGSSVIRTSSLIRLMFVSWKKYP